MLRAEDLPRANGMILMATFLAIIFGLSAAGAAKQQFSSTLWLASIPCLGIAVAGLASSLLIRQTPVAQPALRFDASSIAIAPETRQLLRGNRTLLGVLVMSSVFWFVGGTIYPPAINALCKEQFHFDDLITGILAASTGVGIAMGCVTAGLLSKDRVRAWIVKLGAWGLTASLLMLALPGPGWEAVRDEIRVGKQAAPLNASAAALPADDVSGSGNQVIGNGHQVHPFYRGTMLGPYGSAVGLICVGLFAGFYSVPLQVYLQTNAPSEQKGRIIGAMNLMNWIGIFGAGAVYWIGNTILVGWLMLPQATMFGFAAALMLPVALLYHPPETKVAN